MDRAKLLDAAVKRFADTVNVGIKELGLTETFLIEAFKAKGNPISGVENGRINFLKIPVCQWVEVCQFLLVYEPSEDLDLRKTLVENVGQAILNGTFSLPITSEVRNLFEEYINSDKANWKLVENIFKQVAFFKPGLFVKTDTVQNDETNQKA